MGSNNLVDGQENILDKISSEEIDQCIFLLEKLVGNGHRVFELPEEKRVALLKAAGQLSRPAKSEFKQRKKDAAKAAKRKMIERDKHARKETGIRSAREAAIFVAPKLLAAPLRSHWTSLNWNPLEIVMSVKRYTPSCITSMIPCVRNVAILIMQNAFNPPTLVGR